MTARDGRTAGPGGRTEAWLTRRQARSMALRSQGFADPRPRGVPDVRAARRVLDRVGVVQVDSVNVIVRSQELPLFARLGPHPRDLWTRLVARKEVFEYWAHEASLLPVDLQPALRWRMEAAARGEGVWSGIRSMVTDNAEFVERVYRQVVDRGPLSAGELADGGERTTGMWGRSPGKWALEALFWAGRLSATRGRNFERCYDLTERLLPAEVLRRPTPAVEDAHRELLSVAARALGVATERDLLDYFRLPPAARDRLAELAEEGVLAPVRVEGSERLPWWRWVGVRSASTRPVSVPGVLLSPFDSLVWERSRVERLFGFRYRLEIYTPAHKREFGYYVLPFLLDDLLVARVDLKADRSAGVLRVRSAHGEPGIDRGRVAERLSAALEDLSGWLGLQGVDVEVVGNLSAELRFG